MGLAVGFPAVAVKWLKKFITAIGAYTA